MVNTDRLRSAGHGTIQRHCRRVLLYATYLAGPTWGRRREVNFVQPWSFEELDVCEYGKEEDVFRVPVSETYISKRIVEFTVSRPTILLPTRDNLVGLLNTIESLPGHSPEFTAHLRWTRSRLNDNGGQYGLRSHLGAKQQAAEPSAESQTLLQQFLRQTEPPERDIEPADVSDVAIEEEDMEDMTEEDGPQSEESDNVDWEDDSETGEL